MSQQPIVRWLGPVDYQTTYHAMQHFTETRLRASTSAQATPDEIWLCEHPPVLTQGLAGRAQHILQPGTLPLIQTNRGGQVTYHGPGQVVAYPLIDLARLGIYVKEYVFRLEQALLKVLAHYGVTGHRVPQAPGIYVRLADPFGHAVWVPQPAEQRFSGLAKIAALGIKVSRHCTYHGVALNVAMDLAPFNQINPCGYEGLQTTDLASLGISVNWQDAAQCLANKLAVYLSP